MTAAHFRSFRSPRSSRQVNYKMAILFGLFELEEVISQNIGFPAHVLRFLLSLFLAYPLAFLYRAVFQSKPMIIQHYFFSFVGFSLLYFCFGWNCLHSLANIIMAYCLIHIGGPTMKTVVSSFILNLGYLHVAYYYRSLDEFMLDWSVPHCILCLRLTGIAWDYYDGNNYNNNEISDDMKTTRISTPPTLLEMTGFCYFFGGFLVGPQFPFRRYQALVEGTLQDKSVDNSLSIAAGLQRLLSGIVYMVLFVLFNPSFNANHFLTEWYENISLPHRFWFFIWFYEVMYMKYLGLFLLSEGSCIIAGLGYNGKNENGEPRWDAVTNIRILDYETSYSIQHVIQSFHLQTSSWIMRYVYKRAKFLGNKILSLAVAQGFLAVWHGVHPGYYVLFFCQFLIIIFERSVLTTWKLLQWRKISEMPAYVQVVVIPFLYSWSHMLMGYGSSALALMYLDKIHKVGKLTYYAPFFAIIIWILIVYPFVVLPLLRPKKPKNKTS